MIIRRSVLLGNLVLLTGLLPSADWYSTDGLRTVYCDSLNYLDLPAKLLGISDKVSLDSVPRAESAQGLQLTRDEIMRAARNLNENAACSNRNIDTN